MAQTTHGLGELKYDPTKRTRAPGWNVCLALVVIVLIFEVLNRLNGGSFLFNMRDNVDSLFNQQRLDIMILQVAITGIIGIGTADFRREHHAHRPSAGAVSRRRQVRGRRHPVLDQGQDRTVHAGRHHC